MSKTAVQTFAEDDPLLVGAGVFDEDVASRCVNDFSFSEDGSKGGLLVGTDQAIRKKGEQSQSGDHQESRALRPGGKAAPLGCEGIFGGACNTGAVLRG